MPFIYLVTGVLLLGLTLVDIIKTTLVFTHTGGPVTERLTNLLWHMLPKRTKAAIYVGPLLLLSVVVLWLVLSWLAWWLIFNSTPEAVINAQTKQEASATARFYFVGFNLFTLGIGDFVPQGGLWRFVTILSAAQGFFVITLSITYVLPVISAITERRQLARQLYFLGEDPATLLLSHWNGQNFGVLEDRLMSLLPNLILLEQRNFTYPVLHYFLERQRSVAIEPGIVVLDEAMTLLRHGFVDTPTPQLVIIDNIQRIVRAYLDTLQAQYITPADTPLAETSHETLHAAGFSVVATAQYHLALEDHHQHRRNLHALLIHSGWDQD